ncbi:MAG: hypothetical protein RLZZ283_378 [Candidatus Parcubacteria bacterium]|jgi:hypothetical protein
MTERASTTIEAGRYHGHWPLNFGAEPGRCFRWNGYNCTLVSNEPLISLPAVRRYEYTYWTGSKTETGVHIVNFAFKPIGLRKK